MLRDWPAMTEMLLEEPTNKNDALEPNAELALIDIILSTVSQAASGSPGGRTGVIKRTNITVKERTKQDNDVTAFTEHFITELPKLITKYQSDPDRLNLLLQIPRYFKLELYATNRQEANLDLLLKQLANVMQINIQDEVLENCCRVFELLCENREDAFSIYQRSSLQRDYTAERISQNFHKALVEFQNTNAYNKSLENHSTMSLIDDKGPAYAALMWLKRFSWLLVYNDVIPQSSTSGTNIADTCFELLKNSKLNADSETNRAQAYSIGKYFNRGY